MRVATSQTGTVHIFERTEVLESPQTGGAESICGAYTHHDAFSGMPEDLDILDNVCSNCERALDESEE